MSWGKKPRTLNSVSSSLKRDSFIATLNVPQRGGWEEEQKVWKLQRTPPQQLRKAGGSRGEAKAGGLGNDAS